MSTETGIVRDFDAQEGWGVIDSPATPGGCWVHYSAVQISGYKLLTRGQTVSFTVERVRQDGFDFRAVEVHPHDIGLDHDGGSAYASTLVLDFDGGPTPVRVVRGADLEAADPTPGMHRERAFEVPRLWSGRVTTAPGAVSGWHHHELNETSLYVVSGVLRLEFAGSAEPLDARAGDFVHVPAFTVHRESNPTDEPSVAVIARAGGGVPTVNVDQPPPPYA